MENRVVALAVLENLIHWPLPNRSGYVANTPTTTNTVGGAGGEEGGEEDSFTANTVSAGDAEDLLREPRQRKLDRYRAVLLLPHLCHKLGTRWVESEVVPYLLRCLEEDDPQLAVVSGLALLGVTMPRRHPLAAAAASPTSLTSGDSAGASKAAGTPNTSSPPGATSSSSASTTNTAGTGVSVNAYLSLEDVQPVCVLLAASATEETRAFAAQVVLPHLYFGTSLERDVTLESWDIKYVPLSVLHADMLTSSSGNGVGEDGDVGGGGEDESGAADAAGTLRFVSAVRKQLVRQRCQEEMRRAEKQPQQQRPVKSGSDGPSGKNTSSSSSPRLNAKEMMSRRPNGGAALTDEELRQACQSLAHEDEAMQFLFSGSYETLTGPWGFSGCRLATLTRGSKALLLPSSSSSFTRVAGGNSNGGAGGLSFLSSGGGFRSFRGHVRRVCGSQALRGAPPASHRPLAGADLSLYGATYAMDRCSSSSHTSSGDDGSALTDDFFSVNVRARSLVEDVAAWMEALTPADTMASPTSSNSPSSPSRALFASGGGGGGAVTPYDYLAHEGRREALRGRWRAQLKLLQSLFESSYPGPVAVAVDLVNGLLHAMQCVLTEVETYLQRLSKDGTAGSPPAAGSVEDAGERKENAELWGIAVPASPLLTTAQLQRFVFTSTRRHIAYCIAAAVTTRKLSVPSTLTKESRPAAWRAPTDTLARLLRASLYTACKTLTDLLLRYHLLVKLQPASPEGQSNGGSESAEKRECLLLQMGAGPCETRAAALSAWDVSFLPSSTSAVRAALEEPTIMPDDASFLLQASAAAAEGDNDTTTLSSAAAAAAAAIADTTAASSSGLPAVYNRSVWLPGTLNAFSIFRVHRIIRRALLRGLPLSVELFAAPTSSSLTSSSAGGSVTSSPTTATPSLAAVTPGSSSLFPLCAVCPMLLQVLVPPGALPGLLQVLYAAARLTSESTSASQAGSHADPVVLGEASRLERVAPALWAAMTAPGSIMGTTAESAVAALQGQETPSSLDFGLLEVALDSVQRLMAEAAAQLAQRGHLLPSPSSSSSSSSSSAAAKGSVEVQSQRAVHALCAPLFALLAACVRWVPRYTNWKARWLIAQRLPHLVSTFCFLLSKIAELHSENGAKEQTSSTNGRTLHPASAQPYQQAAALQWLMCTLQLLTSVWSCAPAFGVAPLNDLTDDEEVEVRCIVVRCAAFVFRRVVEAVLRLSAAISTTAACAASKSSSSSHVQLLLPVLTEPLTQLLDATAQCVLVGANDVDARVRCRSAEALAVLSRTLSMLVAADTRAKLSHNNNNNSSTSTSNNEVVVWPRYLRSNTDALLRLMSDEKPTVQLALVSQLTDLLLMRMRQSTQTQKEKSSLMGSREDVDAAVPGAENNDLDRNNADDASADQVQHEALLQCLRQLAQHELWRLREQYAILLAHLCGRLLQTAMFQPRRMGARLTSASTAAAAASPTTSFAAGGAMLNASLAANENMSGSIQPTVALYGHTHPLYQLARTELLTLLVAVLFDKVKAVRDSALDAVERMCLQLAAANRQSNNSLQQDSGALPGMSGGAGGMGGGGGCGGVGAGGVGGNFESILSSNALQNGSAYNCNTFVDDVLWPRINAFEKAWETYLSRSALLHIALRLRVDKTSIFIPLLDQLARDPVLNVRLVVAKIILEVLLRSSPDVYAMGAHSLLTSSLSPSLNKDGEDEGKTSIREESAAASSYKPELPSGTVAYRILMNKPPHPLLSGGSYGNTGLEAALPPLQFDEEERTGVVLQILRQLLKDASSDVRDEAAKALKVCF